MKHARFASLLLLLNLTAAAACGDKKGNAALDTKGAEVKKGAETGAGIPNGHMAANEPMAPPRVADPMSLVPQDVTFVARVDLGGLMKSKLYTDSKADLENDSQAKEMLEAAKACNLSPESFKSLTIGIEPRSENVVAVVSGDGVGNKENLDCIGVKIKEKSGKDAWTIEEKDGMKVMTIDGGDGTGYLVNDGTVVVASKDWAGAVKELVGGKGKSVAEGALKDVLGRADKGKHIWFAGQVPSDMVQGTPATEVKDVSGSLDMSNGLAVALAAGVSTEDNAKKLHEEATKQFEGAKAMAPMMGVPQSVVDSVKIGRSGATVTMAMTMTNDDLAKLQDGMGKMMGGLLGGGGGAPMPMDDGGVMPIDDASLADSPAEPAAPE